MEALRPNQQRAKLAIIFIWIVFGTEMLALISEVMQYFLLQSAKQGTMTDEEATMNDLREGLISLFYLVMYIASIITFIQWFRRAYFNLGLLTNKLSTTDGWAAGAWFVPIMSLYRPYQMMKEMFLETNTLLKNKVEGYSSLPSAKTVGVWWTFWIISNILGNVVFRIEARADSVDQMIMVSIMNIILGFLAVPLALITVRLIKEYAAMEIELSKVTPLSANDPWSTLVNDPKDQ